MSGNTSRRYPPELKARAVRMYAEIRPEHESDWQAMGRVAELLDPSATPRGATSSRLSVEGRNMPTVRALAGSMGACLVVASVGCAPWSSARLVRAG